MTPQADFVGRRGTSILGLYLVTLGIALIYLTAVIWPPDFEVAAQRVGATKDQKDVESPIVFPGFFGRPLGGTVAPSPSPRSDEAARPAAGNIGGAVPVTKSPCVSMTYDRRLLLLVIIVGALGSYIHVVSSFGDFVGNRTFTRSWIWWYLLRPFVGVPLALLFYFAIRAGFLTAGASAGDVNRFGIAAVAGLVGMFSVTAADKLKEVFGTLFKTDVKREDKLAKPPNGSDGGGGGGGDGGQTENPTPAISSIEVKPDVIRILGSGFTEASRVLINSIERPSSDITLVSGNELTVARRKEEKGQVTISVSNPAPGGGNIDNQTVNLADV
jgi:hypothetical protein